MSADDKKNDTKPVMLYDGDCAFCQCWIEKWNKITESNVTYEPYQKAAFRYPQISEKDCQKAVQLIMTDGRVFKGAHAVFKALALSGRNSAFLWCYEHMVFFAAISEWFYRIIARHRSSLSKISGEQKCKI